VRDDGKGFVAGNRSRDDGGRGIASMIDRARRAGGTLKIEGMPGGGTCVIVAVPLGQHDHAMQSNLHA
jgi:signal transduction histidine kinase